MAEAMSYGAMALVIESWERARQIFGCDEQVGMKIMLNMFQLEPQTKAVFGFAANQNVEANPLLRMGVLVHAARIIHMLDSVVSLLGPDTDVLDEVLRQVGEQHKKQGVKKEHFIVLIQAVCHTLQEIFDNKWSDENQTAWENVLGKMAEIISLSM